MIKAMLNNRLIVLNGATGSTVEPLFNGHLRDRPICPLYGGVLYIEVIMKSCFYHNYNIKSEIVIRNNLLFTK